MKLKVCNMRLRSIAWTSIVWLLLFGALVAAPKVEAQDAATAGSTVKAAVEEVRQTVTEQKDKVSPAELDEMLKKIIYPVFDFEEMSRRSLGANWKKASADEQKEFVTLFSDLLARNYLKKIRENAADSEFSITGETGKGDRMLVKTVVKYNGDQVKIDYRLRENAGTWKVYDVVIENVGLVSNYRSEFAGIVSKEGMSGLLKRLREKK